MEKKRRNVKAENALRRTETTQCRIIIFLLEEDDEGRVWIR